MATPTVSIDPFSSAASMLEALRRRDVSAVELLELHLDRIARYNGELNVIVTPNEEGARRQARESDERRARGEANGALDGLTIVIKDSNQVAGLKSTAGISALADNVPAEDGLLAQRVFAAGAVLIGKTNIPPFLSDWQSNNPIFGRTVNPWDHSRSPGGSTGGAAAVAAGLAPLEFGSDIGGSIRVPAAFCGIFGHKPSETAVPRSGSFPPHGLPSPVGFMGVQGPLARSADDLEIALDVIAGPDIGEEHWRLELPAARHQDLRSFRVAVFPGVDWVPVCRDVREAQERVVQLLKDVGAAVEVAVPEGLTSREHYATYEAMLQAMTSGGMNDEQRQEIVARLDPDDPRSAALKLGLLATLPQFREMLQVRERSRSAYRAFFREYDVLLAPITIIPAFEHDDRPFGQRTIDVDGEVVPYGLQIFYPSIATLPGQPATAFPVGLNAAGLPIGLQAIGPYLEDRTPIHFSRLLERELGGFVAPPRYAVEGGA